jgi:hypothetical protein
MYIQNTNQANNDYEEKNQYLPRFRNLFNVVTITGALLILDAAATLSSVNNAIYGTKPLIERYKITRTHNEVKALSSTVRHGCGLEAILGLGFAVGGIALTKKKEEKSES